MSHQVHHSKAKIFDSFDPNYPDLPNDLFLTNDSDEFTDLDQDEENLSNNRLKKRKQKKSNRKNRKYTESAYSSTAARERIKWEPGIDINTTDVILSSMGSSVTITDYNETRYRVERIDVKTNYSNTEESEEDKDSTLAKEDVGKLENLLRRRPAWSKVRWINVNGLSWESITTIGKYYNLHRLAIEDMVDIPSRTKVDIYPGCLFGVLPLIKLVKNLTEDLEDIDIDDFVNDKDHVHGPSKWWSFFSSNKKKEKERTAAEVIDPTSEMSINELLSEYYEMRRLNDSFKPKDHTKPYQNRAAKYLNDQKPLSYRNLFVGIEQCSFFLLSKGVIITFFESSGDDIEGAILSRISKEETILRSSCDPSILLHNILDVIVDIIYPIITAYRKRLNEFEVDVLINPNIRHTQSLHLMSGELANLRRSILPITSIINSFRDLSDRDELMTKESEHHNNKNHQKLIKSQNNFISQTSEIYFADIVDHTLMFTDEIEGMVNNIDNLIALIFNTISTDTNNSMRQLSLVTVIFLPLSFWTGYYGMNFTKFGDLENHVSYYWKIAVPFSVVLVVLLTWNFVKVYLIRTKRTVGDLISRISSKLKQKKTSKRHRRKKKRFTTHIEDEHIV